MCLPPPFCSFLSVPHLPSRGHLLCSKQGVTAPSPPPHWTAVCPAEPGHNQFTATACLPAHSPARALSLPAATSPATLRPTSSAWPRGNQDEERGGRAFPSPGPVVCLQACTLAQSATRVGILRVAHGPPSLVGHANHARSDWGSRSAGGGRRSSPNSLAGYRSLRGSGLVTAEAVSPRTPGLRIPAAARVGAPVPTEGDSQISGHGRLLAGLGWASEELPRSASCQPSCLATPPKSF
ncbi:hypothetical protein NDU88_008534 [Pleurodeles waltl]|uniref:Uncharacterized protein n=1 Tax=Pleurodeles waltl TaxID=8319 RepID=A0AAV7QS14_PLEWA|nr:hypothetical protein NDU88_008534 [Pleurodeles waltl]